MTTWIIFFALALLSIVVFVFALRSQQDAEALEDRLAGTIDEEAAAHPHQAGGIMFRVRLIILMASSRCRNGFSRPLALG